jgi:hypothetical protein
VGGRAAIGAVSLALWCAGSPAHAKPRVVFSEEWRETPSARYAALDGAECVAELTRRRIAFDPVRRAPGVLSPVRLPEGVGGVVYRTALPALERAHSPYDVFDCRLALGLYDLSQILVGRGVDEVIMHSAWRPSSSGVAHPRRARRHAGGLAIDITSLHLAPSPREPAGRWIEIERSWVAAIGRPPCGSGASPIVPSTDDARMVREVVCAAAGKHLFTSVLTPNYDRAHKNHVHLELTPEVAWHLVR